jgi:hypothetical protein
MKRNRGRTCAGLCAVVIASGVSLAATAAPKVVIISLYGAKPDLIEPYLPDEGYNFDSTQSPAVYRLGDDDPTIRTLFSVPNFFGTHGYDSKLPSVSAVLLAAGPDIGRGGKLKLMHNIDIAPTELKILGVRPAVTVDGKIIHDMLKDDHGEDD